MKLWMSLTLQQKSVSILLLTRPIKTEREILKYHPQT